MKIDDFVLENWLNPACDSEKNEIYLGGSCVLPMTVEELFDITGQDLEEFLDQLRHMSLAYPRFEGTPRLKKAIADKLYKGVSPEEVILVHGGTGANNTLLMTLLEPGDNVISIIPNYQQYDSIPKALGLEVREVKLRPQEGYRLIIDEVRDAVDKDTKAILFTNPNNPTGSLLTEEEMRELIDIAKAADCWIVCDEMYRGLKEEYMPSFADMYDKAMVTCSSSKIFSMAGTRVGWIICHDPDMRWNIFNHRSYDSICGGVFDEWIFSIAVENAEKVMARSRRIVNSNKAILDKWLNNHKYLHQYADSYGTTYLVHYDLDIPAEEFADRLLDEKGVLVCHGDCFYIPRTFRITLSHAERLEEGLKRIDDFMNELVASGVKVIPQ